MRKITLCLLLVSLFIPPLFAAEPEKVNREPRELFVPFSDLNVLLEQQPKRVLLSREEYDALVKKAKQSPEEHAPQKALIVSAEYNAKLSERRAEITGLLAVDVLVDGLHAIPLDIAGVGLRSAMIDGSGASLGKAENGPLTLFVEGKGRHELRLEMVAPLQTTAAKQILAFRLPRPSVAKLALSVPGDVDLKSGTAVISRKVETLVNGKQTRFDLLPREGDVTLEMTLNSHLQRQSRAVIARSILVDEVTEGYEKLRATVSLEILYQPMDQFRFAVPDGFEITEVVSPLLARWDVQELAGKKALNIKLREQTNETVVLSLSALRTPSRVKAWQLPQLHPIPLDDGKSDVIAEAAIVGVVVEDRLKIEWIEAEGLIAIDTSVLGKTLPANIFQPLSGVMPLKAVAAYYAPEGKYRLTAKFITPPAEMAVNTSLLWRVSDKGYEVLGGFTLLPRGEKLFSFDFTTPPDWTINSVTAAGEKSLKFERYGEANQSGRVRVYVPQGMAAGQEFKVNFQAVRTPKGWLGDWKSEKCDFPIFAVAGAARDEGAIAVEARDDITVRPETAKTLIPLDDTEKAQYGLEGVATNLAYRYENPRFDAKMVFERTAPRASARSYSFLRISPDGLKAHYELIYNIEEARTQNLSLVLPENTPTALSISGLDGIVVKEFSPEPVVKDNLRQWNVLLAEAKRGQVRLAVDFQQIMPSQEPKNHPLPIIAANNVIYQSGLVAVEGCAEFDVQVATSDRKVDVGELVDADYQPGRRLLGVYGFSGAPSEVKINVSRNPSYPIYPAIVEKALLVTHLSPDGESHTEAVFRLRTKAFYMELQLPALSELWSAEIDGMPIKPQRENKNILIGLPATSGNTTHTLQIVYRTPTSTLGMFGAVELSGPKLLLRADRNTKAVEVPLADLEWKLCLPSGYEVIRSTGTVTTDNLAHPMPAAMLAVGALYEMSGGVGRFGLLSPALRSARESGSSSVKSASNFVNSEYYSSDDVKYNQSDRSAPASTASSREPPADARQTADKVDSISNRRSGVLEESKKPAKNDSSFGLAVPQFGGFALKEPAKPVEDPDGKKGVVARSETLEQAVARDAEQSLEMNKLTDLSPSFTHTPAVSQPGPSYNIAKSYSNKLTGVRSLKISLEETPQIDSKVMIFQSLGVGPVMKIELADRQRFAMLGWAVALIAFLIGAAISRRAVWSKFKYIACLALIATLAPVILDNAAVAWVCNMLFFAACWLVPYYLLAGLARLALLSCCRRTYPDEQKTAVAAVVLPIALMMLSFDQVNAQDTPKPGSVPYVIQVVEPGPPVRVPDDVIIVPYDPDVQQGKEKSQRLLLPYDKYVELWNRAYPDKKLETKKPPADYALSGATYKTTLEGDEFMLVSGELDINVYSTEYVQIPLGLNGGVLSLAELDGKPARLSLVTPAQPAAGQTLAPQQTVAPKPGGASPGLLLLTLEGKGRHKLSLAVRLKIVRDGGWRSVEGMLPFAPASACTITVPLAPTELRLTNTADRVSYDIEKPGETIATALGPGGSLWIRWRAKAAEAKVDRALTARSDAVLDVQEDGLRWTWQLNLDFRGNSLDEFSLAVPSMYVVEKVEGNNIRGWQIEKNDAGQNVKIALLKAAKDREQIVLTFSKAEAVGQGDQRNLTAGLVQLNQAALHTGRILIRRSPLLDLLTIDRAGMTRSDISQDLMKLAGTENTASPLGIRPYEAYQFDRNPASPIRLEATPVQSKMTAGIQSILKISDTNRTLESRILYHVLNRPVFALQMYLPEDFRLDHLSLPGDYEYAITKMNDRRLLTVFLTSGRMGDFAVLMRGTLGKQTGFDKLPLPELEVLGVERQQGDIAVQANAAYDIEALDLKNCDKVLLDRFYGWLKPEQQSLTRLALQYRRGDYSGALKLTPRKPEVACDTITNVRITDRAIEETVLLDFTIQGAGIRKVSFVLPWWMKDAKIHAPMLRVKSNEPQDGGEKSPRLVKIELQDEVMGQLRVLVENDRQLENSPQQAPIPTVEDVRVNRRYATLESSGRDEITIESDQLAGMEKLIQGQKEWDHLKEILGRAITYAYLVAPDADAPKLVYKSNMRSAVQTAGARIGLVQTNLVIDQNAAYRAEQVINIFNSTEQFLEIELPLDAKLWTAWVAGEPVKPVQVAANDPRGARIPLVKSAVGDLPYQIVLRYGGQMSPIGNLMSVNFPFIRCVNVNPELSQVRLYLPEDRQWFDFGGTMRQVEEDADLMAGEVSYQTKVAENLRQTVQQSSKFAQIRAANNLKQIGMTMGQYRSSVVSRSDSNLALKKELAINENALQTAQKEAEWFENTPANAEAYDNRQKLGELFLNQSNTYTGGILVQSGGNWDVNIEASQPGGRQQGQQFNEAWLGKNKLLNQVPAAKGQPDQEGKALEGQSGAAYESGLDKSGKASMRQRPSAAQVAQGKFKQELSESNARQQNQQTVNGTITLNRGENLFFDQQAAEEQRYKDRLARQQTDQPQNRGTFFGATTGASLSSSGERGDNQQPAGQPAVQPATPQAIARQTSDPNAYYQPNEPAPSDPAHAITPPPPEKQGVATAAPGNTGLASLDFQLPVRGTVYRFTTPRGEVKITTRSVSNALLGRLLYASCVVAVILLIAYLIRLALQGSFTSSIKSSATALMIVLGLFLLFFGILPILGAVAIVTGIVLKIMFARKKHVLAN